MTITFSNGIILPYLNALAIESDFKNGETRKSIKIDIPYNSTSFEEIYQLYGMDFTLTGDESFDEEGNSLGIPMTVWTDYSVKGEIQVSDDIISFKVYRLTDAEMALNELLIEMSEE